MRLCSTCTCYSLTAPNVGQLLKYVAGTPPTVTLAAHYEYDPYGNVLVANDVDSSGIVTANPFRFSTKWFDAETGLYYYGYRYYLPRLGRWINRDPIEEAGGLSLYQFVSDSPVNYVDPYGLWKDHTELLTKSYDRFWAWRQQQPSAGGNPGEGCRKDAYSTLGKANSSQDKGQAFNENFRHYNRDLNEPVAQAKTKFQDYIAKEIGWLRARSKITWTISSVTHSKSSMIVCDAGCTGNRTDSTQVPFSECGAGRASSSSMGGGGSS